MNLTSAISFDPCEFVFPGKRHYIQTIAGRTITRIHLEIITGELFDEWTVLDWS